MGQLLLEGEPPITVELKRNARSRRLSLRVSRLDGRVTLSLPNWTRQAEAIAFAREKEVWIRGQLRHCPDEVIPHIDGMILFEGQEVPIIAGSGRAARFINGNMVVPGDPERAPARIAAYLKVIARQRLDTACTRYAGFLGKDVNRITLRDTRSRWGSCTTDGNLMFSWRLVMAPVKVLDYVAAHEVAHLVEMNHSAAYWKVVSNIFPDYKMQRGWLRVNGARLHAYRFRN